MGMKMEIDGKKIFERLRITSSPLKERCSKVEIESAAAAAESGNAVPPETEERVEKIAAEIAAARKKGASVICAFGAHAIKNGLGRLLGAMLKKGWLSHLASNGAAVIHDWEFSFLGKSSEDVRENAAAGRFGTWEETGLYINLALAAGAWEGLGYGAAVGAMILKNGIDIPARAELLEAAGSFFKADRSGALSAGKAAAALDYYGLIEALRIPSGFLSVNHPWSSYSVLAAAGEAGRPFTCHPMFGHDIIYTHRASRGAAIGRTAERDFLEYVAGVENLEGGVYLSVGSAVMSPMIFEKALSMARNAAGGNGTIRDCGIHVVDLQESSWNWSGGEPPADNPAYYLRFMKTFNRMGCRIDYTRSDNRDFFTALYKALEKTAD
ncbi:MAG: hypothetical protein LBI86_04230 [Treponema sp.]|jgi:hypothetical protein|nr:hypothetical protein [Treponema sp.]